MKSKLKKSVEVVRIQGSSHCNSDLFLSVHVAVHAKYIYPAYCLNVIISIASQPANIKAFIDAVVEAPAEDMSNVLDAFVWSYDKVFSHPSNHTTAVAGELGWS
jgi:hypothetical protein